MVCSARIMKFGNKKNDLVVKGIPFEDVIQAAEFFFLMIQRYEVKAHARLLSSDNDDPMLISPKDYYPFPFDMAAMSEEDVIKMETSLFSQVKAWHKRLHYEIDFSFHDNPIFRTGDIVVISHDGVNQPMICLLAGWEMVSMKFAHAWIPHKRKDRAACLSKHFPQEPCPLLFISFQDRFLQMKKSERSKFLINP